MAASECSTATPPQHIALLGGGIIGLASAHYILASASLPQGSTVTLVENSRQGVAPGASSQAGGFLAGGERGTWVNPRSYDLARLSWTCFRGLAGLLDGVSRFGWAECGATGLRVGEGDASKSAYRNLPIGAAVGAEEGGRWLEGEREDLSGPGMGQVDPAEFCQTLHAFLTMNPAFTTLFGEPMSLSTRSPTSHTLTVQPHHCATATTLDLTAVVVCAGPWTAALCARLGLPVPPISNLPGHSLLIRPSLSAVCRATPLPVGAVFAGINGAEGGVHASTSGEARHLTPAERAEGYTKAPELFARANGLVYCAGENSITTCGADGALPHRLPANVDLVRPLLDPRLVARLESAAAQCSSALDVAQGAVVEAKQFCFRPVTPDGDPIIDVLVPGVVLACGHGPWGITLAPGTGQVVAELVLEGAARSADISTLRLGRFPQKSKL